MTSMLQTKNVAGALLLCGGLMVAFALRTDARQSPRETVLDLRATSANVGRSGQSLRINIFRWSTDDERDATVVAMTNPEAAPAVARGGGRGGGGGGFGGGGGRGGRGNAPPPPPPTPIEALTATLAEAPTIGYIWPQDSGAGYAITYAAQSSMANGGERVILVTRRRLDAYTPFWTPTSSDEPTNYDFTLIEMHLDADGSGEGRTSLTTGVSLENATNTLVLDDYTGVPVIFDGVRSE